MAELACLYMCLCVYVKMRSKRNLPKSINRKENTSYSDVKRKIKAVFAPYARIKSFAIYRISTGIVRKTELFSQSRENNRNSFFFFFIFF